MAMVFYSAEMTDNGIAFEKSMLVRNMLSNVVRLFLDPRGKNVGFELMKNKEVVKATLERRVAFLT